MRRDTSLGVNSQRATRRPESVVQRAKVRGAPKDRQPAARPHDAASTLCTDSLLLRQGAAEYLVPDGTWLVGRGQDCAIVVCDPLVSRHHARLRAGGGRLLIEDLESTNGLFVNDVRVTSARSLVPGDVIAIGSNQFTVAQGMSRPGARIPLQDDARSRTTTIRVQEPEEHTRQCDMLGVLGGVAEKAIAEGYSEQAERLLSPVLRESLSIALAGKHLDASRVDQLAERALMLALATRKPAWIDYVFDLYRSQLRSIPEPLVDRLYALASHVRPLAPDAVRHYLAKVQVLGAPHQRLHVRRIEGLRRIMLSGQ